MGVNFSGLKIHRRRRGLTQDDIAERLGVSRQTVAKWERGESAPDIESCVALADLYGVSLDILVRDIPENESGKHVFGVAKLNEKGQVTLPAECRRVFGIEPGDLVLILGDEGRGIAIVKLEGNEIT